MSNFTAFPREIRDMIYGYALVYHHVLNIEGSPSQVRKALLPRAYMGAYITPVALLGVCKSINGEAAPIFYGRNTFALPDVEIKKHSPFVRQAALFRRIVVDLPGNSYLYGR